MKHLLLLISIVAIYTGCKKETATPSSGATASNMDSVRIIMNFRYAAQGDSIHYSNGINSIGYTHKTQLQWRVSVPHESGSGYVLAISSVYADDSAQAYIYINNVLIDKPLWYDVKNGVGGNDWYYVY